jgi:hypothetical protein
VLVNDGNWRPPSPGASPSDNHGPKQSVAIQQQPAATAPAQLPAPVVSADAVLTDGSWVAPLIHHQDQVDATALDWTNFVS